MASQYFQHAIKNKYNYEYNSQVTFKDNDSGVDMENLHFYASQSVNKNTENN